MVAVLAAKTCSTSPRTPCSINLFDNTESSRLFQNVFSMFSNLSQCICLSLFLGLIDGTTSALVLVMPFCGSCLCFSLKRVPSSLTFPGCNIPGIGGGGGVVVMNPGSGGGGGGVVVINPGRGGGGGAEDFINSGTGGGGGADAFINPGSGGGGGAADFIKSGTGGGGGATESFDSGGGG